MRLEFTYLPTADLGASLRLYRDTLGFDELWREGDHTVGLAVPGTDVALMIDAAAPPGWGPGPIFGVDRVTEFRAAHDGLEVLTEPEEIPGGMLMALRDPGGNCVYVMDQSTDTGDG
jgi:catechol 2,3-dioxygenase-like lactoylglutathione lyase family enzyme